MSGQPVPSIKTYSSTVLTANQRDKHQQNKTYDISSEIGGFRFGKPKEEFRPKAQHHPGMTVAEIALQASFNFDDQRDSHTKAPIDIEAPGESVLTSIGELVKNISENTPNFK